MSELVTVRAARLCSRVRLVCCAVSFFLSLSLPLLRFRVQGVRSVLRFPSLPFPSLPSCPLVPLVLVLLANGILDFIF